MCIIHSHLYLGSEQKTDNFSINNLGIIVKIADLLGFLM